MIFLLVWVGGDLEKEGGGGGEDGLLLVGSPAERARFDVSFLQG